MLYAKELTEAIIGAAIEVHRSVGPGCLESTYEQYLYHELELRGLSFRYQVPLPLSYKGLRIENAYRIDLIVENSVIVELTAVEQILPIHEAQLLTYLRLANKRVGLIINFNVAQLKDGIVRRVL